MNHPLTRAISVSIRWVAILPAISLAIATPLISVAHAVDSVCGYSIICVDKSQYEPDLSLQLAQQDVGTLYALTEIGTRKASIGKSTLGYPEMLWKDTKHVLTAPKRWTDEDWEQIGWATVGIAGVIAFVDRPVQDFMRRIAPDNDRLSPNDSRFLHQVERFGRMYSLGLLGGFYVAGTLNDDDTAIAVAQDGLTATIIASGIITTTGKIITGRARPRTDRGHTDFQPFGGNHSFPSGHTTHAFAIASVIANHYDETWVSYASYTVASLVGVARSYHGGHYTSDILTGAMIGTLVGKSVVSYNQQFRTSNIAVIPEFTPGMAGLRLVSSF
ncbi:MAG: phosphatase PAP2 family protein [Gallionella sp.]